MQPVVGQSNWKLACQRTEDGVTILQARTCDTVAVLPSELFGLPVTALGSYALTPGRWKETGGEVFITGSPVMDTEHYENGTLCDLTLPKFLQQVGEYTFYNCTDLGTVRLWDSVQFWGGGALMNCRNLNTVFLNRTEEEGETLFYFADELSRELDVTLLEAGDTVARLIFPEYQEIYEENCPAHHFDYSIYGAGYPYHHCFHQRKLGFSAYDALWKPFLKTEHDDRCALRLAYCRLRWPKELSKAAAEEYRNYLHVHAGAMLRLMLEENAVRDLPFLLRQIRPEKEALSAACGLARRKGMAEAMGILLEEQHRRFPLGVEKTFDL